MSPNPRNFTTLRHLLDRVRVAATGRNPKFPAAERAFIKTHPACEGCDGRATTAHHIIPFHVRPDLEMDESNWAAVCPPCHFVDGHRRNWKKWVENFRAVVAAKKDGVRGPLKGPAS